MLTLPFPQKNSIIAEKSCINWWDNMKMLQGELSKWNLKCFEYMIKVFIVTTKWNNLMKEAGKLENHKNIEVNIEGNVPIAVVVLVG